MDFSLDDLSYNSSIKAYCHEKDFHKVKAVLEEMQEKECGDLYNCIAGSRKGKGYIWSIRRVKEKMKQNGVVPDSSFHISLIYIPSKAGRIKDAHDEMLVNLIQLYFVFGEPYGKKWRGCWNQNLFCMSGELEHGCSFFEETVLRGFVPWDNLYKMLVKELDRKYMKRRSSELKHPCYKRDSRY